MRILYVSGSAALGGAERVLLDAASGMRARGHDVRVIVSGAGPLAAQASAVARIDVLPFPPRFAELGESGRSTRAVLFALPAVGLDVLRHARRIRSAVAPWRPDVVHTHGTKAHVLMAAAGVPGRLLWHLHEYVGARPVSARLLRVAAPRSAGAIAVSSSVAADAARALPRLHTWTVPNAVDLERFRPAGPRFDLDAVAALPPAPPGTVRVGLVATYAWWKGHGVFLEALARLGTDARIRGYVLGGPVYETGAASQVRREDLQRSIVALGLDGRVGLTGFVHDVPAAMRSLDVVVHASTEPEPFGLVIAEAMACGRPLVVSRAGGAAELVVEGVDAVTFAPRDAGALAQRIEALASDPALRARLGEAARLAACARFDVGRFVDALEAIYDGLRGEAA